MHPEPQRTIKRGFFLTFEGLDGSGKTTQIRLLKQSLERDGAPVIETRQPGGTAFGDRMRALLLDSKSTGLSSHAELAMMFADRAQAIQEVITPALEAGKVVLCDRFTDSTEAYQGGGRELGSQIVLELHRLLCGNLQPDLTILLLPDLQTSLARARRRNARSTQDEGRFEREQDAFFGRVHAKYREIADRDPLRVVAIDGDLNLEAVRLRVIQAVEERLEAWRAQRRTSA
jgi:dTMP kinase